MAEVQNQAMTVHDVASYLNVDEKTVYRLAMSGRLPAFKVAGVWRFKRSDLDRWIDLQKENARSAIADEARGDPKSTAFPSKYDREKIETRCRSRWELDNSFKWDPKIPADLDYIIDTPPPTVSGTLHIGHVYSYTQADILARYFRMSGRNVLYPIGWDDNGLPTERLVEKVKKVRGGAMKRDEFVALCRQEIPTYEAQFRNLFSRLALSVDWSREYQTISDESRTVSQLSFLDLYEKGLLERRMEPTLWDPADRTAIAQAEVEETERSGKLYFIAFGTEDGGEVTIATTRPELIGACSALMIHPDHPRASELVGKCAITPLYKVPVPVIADEMVNPEKGTGIVMCCTFGDVTDVQWWRTHRLPLRVIISQAGRMKEDLPIGSAAWPSTDVTSAKATIEMLKGLTVEQARAVILNRLSEISVLRDQKPVDQVIPVAERSGAPLEILVTPQWFVRTLDFKAQIIAKGREINWHPEFMRQRFESWVEGLRWDWSISRQRHFGVPLPVWYSKRDGEKGKVLVARPDKLPVDPIVDLPDGYSVDEVEPETDVMDTWATSSVTPQLVTRTINDKFGLDHEAHKRLFPMTMRPQAHEIIRTWAFYTIVKALHHEGTVPWRTICISGWCLASDGSKMSKSRGNVVDPLKLLDEYGSDVVRYWTGTSRLGNDTVLSPNTLKQGKRLVTKLWNAARFAHIALENTALDPATPKEDVARGLVTHPLDRWLLGRLSETVALATAAFEAYEYAQALRHIENFFWSTYCDNYLEFVKSRTQGEVSEQDRCSAQYTLFHVTIAMIRLFSPFIPFICETLNDLFAGDDNELVPTVHARGNWPKPSDHVEWELCRDIGDLSVEIVAAVRKVKSELEVSLRAPAAAIVVSPMDQKNSATLQVLVAPVLDDIRQVSVARRVDFAESAPEGWAGTVSSDGRVQVRLRLELETQGDDAKG